MGGKVLSYFDKFIW